MDNARKRNYSENKYYRFFFFLFSHAHCSEAELYAFLVYIAGSCCVAFIVGALMQREVQIL